MNWKIFILIIGLVVVTAGIVIGATSSSSILSKASNITNQTESDLAQEKAKEVVWKDVEGTVLSYTRILQQCYYSNPTNTASCDAVVTAWTKAMKDNKLIK